MCYLPNGNPLGDMRMTLSNEAMDASIAHLATPLVDSVAKSIHLGAFIHEATPNTIRREGLASKPLAS